MAPLTPRQRIILAAFAAQPAAAFAPVQIQKLFFLLDRNIAGELNGPLFAFEPYDYGPFDRAIYQELDQLANAGLIMVEHVSPSAGRRRYSLTEAGRTAGQQALGALSSRAVAYMAAVSDWVRKLSFAQLVGSIYQQYPEMKVNSIFKGA